MDSPDFGSLETNAEPYWNQEQVTLVTRKQIIGVTRARERSIWDDPSQASPTHRKTPASNGSAPALPVVCRHSAGETVAQG